MEWKATRRGDARSMDMQQNTVVPSVWTTLINGTYKCNVNVVVLTSEEYGCDMIVRDHHGGCCAGSLVVIPGMNDPTMGEVLCFTEALSWIKGMNFFPLVIESYSLVLIDALSSKQVGNSYFSLMIQDWKVLLCQNLEISFSFIKNQ